MRFSIILVSTKGAVLHRQTRLGQQQSQGCTHLSRQPRKGPRRGRRRQCLPPHWRHPGSLDPPGSWPSACGGGMKGGVTGSIDASRGSGSPGRPATCVNVGMSTASSWPSVPPAQSATSREPVPAKTFATDSTLQLCPPLHTHRWPQACRPQAVRQASTLEAAAAAPPPGPTCMLRTPWWQRQTVGRAGSSSSATCPRGSGLKSGMLAGATAQDGSQTLAGRPPGEPGLARAACVHMPLCLTLGPP